MTPGGTRGLHAGLLGLHARRILTPGTIGTLVLLSIWMVVTSPAANVPQELEALNQGSTQRGAAHGIWTFGLGAAAVIALWRGAVTPDRWFRGEGAWMAGATAPRPALVASCLAGVGLGAAGLSLVLALAGEIATKRSGAVTHRLELAVEAGPRRSIGLLPGERFSQELPDVGPGASIRIRVAPALGGSEPTSQATLSVGNAGSRTTIARRTWASVEAPTGPSTVTLSNDGQGALAVMGPRAVEVWVPSRTWLGAQARMAGHASVLLVLLVSLSLGFAVWMGPAVAALCAGTAWLIARGMAGEASWMPGAHDFGTALHAVAEGRIPPQASASAWCTALVAAAVATFAGSVGTHRWMAEGRG